ncbi:MAG: CpsB/CapC family capsule biosynthesis tyrosine phosphatase [Phycisphaeraceae bacterium]
MTHPTPPQPTGLIDIHSHMIPGVDDGCADLSESLECVSRLQKAGFVGTICTPHVFPEMYPENTPTNIAAWTAQLQQQLRDADSSYQLWPGGELRLFPDAVQWMQEHGVPTLAGSRCVLCDFWEHWWPSFITDTLAWLIQRGYQPILAHPERMRPERDYDQRLADVQKMGVWLQGNFRCMTGEEGYQPDQIVRQLLQQNRYTFMAMDMHRPDSLEGRLDGMRLLEMEFTPDLLLDLVARAPRQHILGEKQ